MYAVTLKYIHRGFSFYFYTENHYFNVTIIFSIYAQINMLITTLLHQIYQKIFLKVK